MTDAPGCIIRLDPALDALVPESALIERITTGYIFTEGPLWRPEGTLWFSDIPGNAVFEWSPDGTVREVLRPGGYDGHSLPAGGFIGPNGMTAAPDGGVVLCQHGNRRIVHIDAERHVTVVVDRYDGRRLNSPNDVVFRSDGTMYFTDPPYGLPLQDSDPEKDLPFNGIFMLKQGQVTLLADTLTRPNGLAFSPDERILYVANSDDQHRYWIQYHVGDDGTLHDGHVLLDVSSHPDAGLPDGLKVDLLGNIFATGPGGVWILTPDGRHLGTIRPPEQPANVGWGSDGRTLYVTAETSVYRVRTTVAGRRPGQAPG